jgi:hypothetical protein
LFCELIFINSQEMIVYHINKGSAIKSVMRPEKFLGSPGSLVFVGKAVNGPV